MSEYAPVTLYVASGGYAFLHRDEAVIPISARPPNKGIERAIAAALKALKVRRS